MNHARRPAAAAPARRARAVPPFAVVLVEAAALLLAPCPARANATTDCFPDRIASFLVGPVGAPPAFNTWEPGIVLGPPGNATPTSGSLAVMSLGRGGVITLEFTDSEIVDGPGADFIAFENPFFCTAPPLAASDPYSVFAEPGIVAVSADGVDFRTFPYDSTALSQVVSQCTDKSLLQRESQAPQQSDLRPCRTRLPGHSGDGAGRGPGFAIPSEGAEPGWLVGQLLLLG